MLNLYFIKNTSNLWTSNHDILLSHVSKQRHDRIKRYYFEEDKILSLYAAFTTRLAISKILKCPMDDLIFDKTKEHKPFLNPNCHPLASTIDFNFSHTKGAVLLGVSTESTLGVDLERKRNAPFEIVKNAFHINEREYVLEAWNEDEKNKRFFEIWTRKEAYTKYLGTGIISKLKAIDTKSPDLDKLLYTWCIDDYVCSVCTD